MHAKASPKITPCMYALLALVLVFLCYMCYTSTKKSKDMHAHSSATDLGPKDRLLFVDPSELASTPQLKNLTPCYDDACQNYKQLAPEVKDVHAQNVRDFVYTTPSFVIMIWAPWCQYCEMFMPDFVAAAKESSIPFAFLNAELVPHSLLSAEGIFQVKGFPTFLKGTVQNGALQLIALQDRPSKSVLVEFAKK